MFRLPESLPYQTYNFKKPYTRDWLMSRSSSNSKMELYVHVHFAICVCVMALAKYKIYKKKETTTSMCSLRVPYTQNSPPGKIINIKYGYNKRP